MAIDLNTPPLTLFFFTTASLTKRGRYSLLLFHQHVNELLCSCFLLYGLSGRQFLAGHQAGALAQIQNSIQNLP
jgi:hypothetical protein